MGWLRGYAPRTGEPQSPVLLLYYSHTYIYYIIINISLTIFILLNIIWCAHWDLNLDFMLRRHMHYPIMLWAHINIQCVLRAGAPGRTRTSDSFIKSEVFYHLNYWRIYNSNGAAGRIRTFEPNISINTLAGCRFKPLSHHRIFCGPLLVI